MDKIIKKFNEIIKRFDEIDKRFDELEELIEKAHREELEYLKLKAENRKRRAEEGLPW